MGDIDGNAKNDLATLPREPELPILQKMEKLLTVISLTIVIGGTFYNMFSKPYSDIYRIKSNLQVITLQVNELKDDIADLKDEIKYLRRK